MTFPALCGGWVNLDLPELQINGEAQVTGIDACPAIEAGAGRVLLGTFTHVSNDLVKVTLQGDGQPLEVTAGHKLWSLDRGDWVQAGDLRTGERLAGEHGAVVVQSVDAEAGEQRVYNLDVETDHRYLVGDLGVLAHNADQCDPTVLQTGGHTISSRTAKKLGDLFGVTPKAIGKAVEALKVEAGLPPDFHGKIWSNGDYTDMDGNLIDNLQSYL